MRIIDNNDALHTYGIILIIGLLKLRIFTSFRKIAAYLIAIYYDVQTLTLENVFCSPCS